MAYVGAFKSLTFKVSINKIPYIHINIMSPNNENSLR